jgi:hypothetical protein
MLLLWIADDLNHETATIGLTSTVTFIPSASYNSLIGTPALPVK